MAFKSLPYTFMMVFFKVMPTVELLAYLDIQVVPDHPLSSCNNLQSDNYECTGISILSTTS